MGLATKVNIIFDMTKKEPWFFATTLFFSDRPYGLT